MIVQLEEHILQTGNSFWGGQAGSQVQSVYALWLMVQSESSKGPGGWLILLAFPASSYFIWC